LQQLSRYHSYLHTAAAILSEYRGGEPFASFSKKYFSRYKKFGSRDRKTISHLCYCFFRVGKSMNGLPVEERILAGLFLCSYSSSEILEDLKPEWNEQAALSIPDKFIFLGQPTALE
jgi:16S rRNA (cytosine967-C5)-methyltransferase